MVGYKLHTTLLEEIDCPEKRLIVEVIRLAIYDFQHPGLNPRHALDASIFLLNSRELAGLCNYEVDEGAWERIIAGL